MTHAGQFKPGQSGNPGGQPKNGNEVRNMARAASPHAIKRLIQLMSHEDARVSLQASEAVLNRGYGKPVQAIQHSGDDGGPIVFQTIYEK